MTRDDCRELVVPYLSGRLSPAEKTAVDQTLANDAELRAEFDELRAIWAGLGLLPEEHPSAALRARFYKQLNSLARSDAPRSKRMWLTFNPAWQLAAAAVIFIAGAWVGRFQMPRANQAAPEGEIAQLRSEVNNLQKTIALAMLDRQSAGARLEGVSWGARVDQPQGQVSTALLTALNHDPNVNVRLSALDALSKYLSNPDIRQAIVASLPVQESPLVQIAVIDALVEARDSGAAPEIRRLSVSSEINPEVRSHARWALAKLESQ